jgi:hypothetical protein
MRRSRHAVQAQCSRSLLWQHVHSHVNQHPRRPQDGS